MGGLEKGLLHWHDAPLARHAAERLAPQVAQVAISANRELGNYAVFGCPVWPDAVVEGVDAAAGPLLGLLTALQRAATPFVACVPCDVPGFPVDLVARLAAALASQHADLAIAAAAHGEVWRPEPVFCLVPRRLGDDLRAYLGAGGRRVGDWCRRHSCATARFADAAAFANLNTPADWAAAEPGSDPGR